MSKFEKVDRWLDSSVNKMVELQSILTAIPALAPENGGDGESKKAAELSRWLETMGLGPVLDYPAPDSRVSTGKRPNLVITRKGSEKGRTIWIMSHLDVVPEGDPSKWKSHPFKVRREGDTIFGRGVEDNQQGLVASVFAMLALENSGIKPLHDIGCIFVSDEETASRYGIRFLLQNHPSLFSKDDLVLVPDAGNPKGTLIEIAEKSILWLKISTVGKQCHASMPHLGKNAFAAASELVVKLNELYKAFPQSDPLFDPPISTFEPTKKESNIPNINTIPGSDVFYLDCRVMPPIPLDDVLSWIRQKADEVCSKHGVTINFDFSQREQAAPPTPAASQIVKALQKAIRDVYNVEGVPHGIGGGTVAAYFRRIGIHVAVWSKLDEAAHQPDEFCRLPNLVGDSKVFSRIFAEN
ncbi:M20 family metallo-hydrolase [bacterium]|nr:M20 family metallo-hydrolase [bacterium]